MYNIGDKVKIRKSFNSTLDTQHPDKIFTVRQHPPGMIIWEKFVWVVSDSDNGYCGWAHQDNLEYAVSRLFKGFKRKSKLGHS